MGKGSGDGCGRVSMSQGMLEEEISSSAPASSPLSMRCVECGKPIDIKHDTFHETSEGLVHGEGAYNARGTCAIGLTRSLDTTTGQYTIDCTSAPQDSSRYRRRLSYPRRPEFASALRRPSSPCIECGKPFEPDHPFHYTPEGPVHGWGHYGQYETCKLVKREQAVHNRDHLYSRFAKAWAKRQRGEPLTESDKRIIERRLSLPFRPDSPDSFPRPKRHCIECGLPFKDDHAFHYTPDGPVHGWGSYGVRGTCMLRKAVWLQQKIQEGWQLTEGERAVFEKANSFPKRPPFADRLERPKEHCIECNLSFLTGDAFHYTPDGPVHGWGHYGERGTCRLAGLSGTKQGTLFDSKTSFSSGTSKIKGSRFSSDSKHILTCAECGRTIYHDEPAHRLESGKWVHGYGGKQDSGTCLRAHRRRVEKHVSQIAEDFFAGKLSAEEVLKLRDELRELEEETASHLEEAEERYYKEKYPKKGKGKDDNHASPYTPSSPAEVADDPEDEREHQFVSFLLDMPPELTIAQLRDSEDPELSRLWQQWEKDFAPYEDSLTMDDVLAAIFDAPEPQKQRRVRESGQRLESSEEAIDLDHPSWEDPERELSYKTLLGVLEQLDPDLSVEDLAKTRFGSRFKGFLTSYPSFFTVQEILDLSR